MIRRKLAVLASSLLVLETTALDAVAGTGRKQGAGGITTLTCVYNPPTQRSIAFWELETTNGGNLYGGRINISFNNGEGNTYFGLLPRTRTAIGTYRSTRPAALAFVSGYAVGFSPDFLHFYVYTIERLGVQCDPDAYIQRPVALGPGPGSGY